MKSLNFNLLAFAILFCSYAIAQSPPPIQQPSASQRMQISQVVGLASIGVDFSRPAVKGREVLGGLIPMDQIWRAGANMNTKLSWDKTITIGGKEIQAGTYGLHMIPGKDEWTIIINSKHESWGSYFYDESFDLHRFTTKIEPSNENQEWLLYGFDNLSNSGCNLYLRWANFKINLPIELNTQAHMIDYLENEYLTNIGGFFWQGFNNAALYCFNENTELEKGLKWADKSIEMNKNFSNLSTRSLLLRRQGKASEAEKTISEAMPLANEVSLNAYGYALLYGMDDTEGAAKIFEKNMKENPESWNVYDSYAEILSVIGKKNEAIKNYEKAMNLAPVNQKQRIQSVIDGLKS